MSPAIRTEVLTQRVLKESEQLVERPVQVTSDVRDLLQQAVGRVRRGFPRRLPATSTSNSCSHNGQVDREMHSTFKR